MNRFLLTYHERQLNLFIINGKIRAIDKAMRQEIIKTN